MPNPVTADPILVTKLYRTAEGPDVLPRNRLFRKLDEARQVPLTLIRAPAGYGKSTLVRQWLDITGQPAAWILLDPQDGQPPVFMNYVVSAVRLLFAGVLQATFDLLHAVTPPPLRLLRTTLINDLDQIAAPFALVLDEFDSITDAGTLGIMAELLRHPPRSLQIILITREEPALPLSTLRNRNQMREFTADDLRFTRQEASDLSARTAGRDLDPAALDRIMDYTDGWITGLRLVLRSMEPGSQTLEHLNAQRHDPNSIAEYLGVEVFSRLGAFEQDMLVRTSILDVVCAPLADALLDQPPPNASAEVLARYTRSSSFITALDPEGVWYRVHPLLREFLLRQLQHRFNAAEIAALHLRASAWLGKAGRVQDSLRHAELGGGIEAVADLVAAFRERLIARNGMKQLDEWLKRLPDRLVNNRIELVLAMGYLAYLDGRLRELKVCSDRALALAAGLAPDTETNRRLLGETAVLQGMALGWVGDFVGVGEAGQRALELLPDEPSSTRVVAQILCGVANFPEGKARQVHADLLDLLQAELTRNVFNASYILHVLCLHNWLNGNLDDLQPMAELLADLGRRHDMLEWVVTAEYFRGIVCYDLNDLPAALVHLQLVLDNPYQIETVYFVQSACLSALILQVLGQEKEADAVALEARRHLLEIGTTDLLPILNALNIELKLRRGKILSEDEIAWDRLVLNFSYTRAPFEPALTYVRLRLARDDAASLDEAEAYLLRLQRHAEQSNRRRALSEVLLNLALVYEAQNKRAEAEAALLQALRWIEASGQVRYLVDAGPRVEAMIRRLPASTIGRDERRRLFDALGKLGTDTPANPLLSQRELDVLRLLGEGLSNEEISTALYISKGTVKQHVHRIFQKLNVTNRTSALREARRRNLLPV